MKRKNAYVIIKTGDIVDNLVIIDDDLEFAKFVFNVIIENKIPYRVINISSNGEEAIQRIDKLNKNDVVLLDLNMPKKSGFEIIQLIAKSKKVNPKICIISGEAELAFQIENYKELITEIIYKPVTTKELVEKLKKLTHQSKKEEERYRIEKELEKFEFNKFSKGYRYLVDCLICLLEFPDTIDNIERDLYPKVASQYKDITYLNVKWSITKTLNTMYRYSDNETICQYFHLDKIRKPSNKMFLHTVSVLLNKEKDEKLSN